jgi:hypothetical protein
VASDRGVFGLGDATFHGAVGTLGAGRSIVGITATSDGLGYWLVGADGGIFPLGAADKSAPPGAVKLNAPVVAGASR